ncbi:MAG: tetratricopeptide repeat protein, partial [Saprospiraceae bacterium]|nr:tetratricopeptide repeat protein [Saprospiraceae bacterium]
VPAYIDALNTAGQPDKALAKTDEAISKGVKTGQMYLLRGNALFNLGKKDDAKAAYQQALSLEPNNQLARQMLSKIGG